MPFNSFDDYPLSWRPDRRVLRRPIYLALALQLEQDILSGYLVPETKLPPQRELADFLDINFTTVTRAYKLCELKGLIHAVPGSGTFVSSYAAQPATISVAQPTQQPVIDLGIVASFEQCNAMILETVRTVAEKTYLEQLFNYDHPTGMPHHKMAAINWMQRFGVETDAEHTAIVSGTQNGLTLATFALFAPGDRVGVDTYTFANFIELARMYRLHLVPIRGDEHGMLAEELEKQCRLNGLQGVYLVPSCANPTTVVMDESRKRELAKVISAHRLLLIEDDTHAFLTSGILSGYEGPLTRLVPERSVYLCGTSKSICSGARVAYMVYSDLLKEAVLKAIYNVNVKTSALDAEIITELILSGMAAKIVQEKRRCAEKANRLFYDIFPGQKRIGHPLSFYRWLPIQSKKPGIEGEQGFLQLGIRVYHSDRFLCGPPQEQRFLRIALATAANFPQLNQGLRIVRQGIEQASI